MASSLPSPPAPALHQGTRFLSALQVANVSKLGTVFADTLAVSGTVSTTFSIESVTGDGPTLTAEQVVDTVLVRSGLTGSSGDTFPSAADIVAILPDPMEGSSFCFFYQNADTTYPIALDVSASVTLVPTNGVFVDPDGVAKVTGVVTNAESGSEAITLFREGNESSQANVGQATSLVTGVTVNSTHFTVFTVSATTAAAATESFVVTNSMVTTLSNIVLSTSSYSGTAGAVTVVGVPQVKVSAISLGSFTVDVTNISAAAALDGALTLSFIVLN